MQLDTATRAVLETIQAAGYAVTVKPNQVAAIDNKTAETFIVRFDNPHRIYDATMELAQRVGIDLMDG